MAIKGLKCNTLWHFHADHKFIALYFWRTLHCTALFCFYNFLINILFGNMFLDLLHVFSTLFIITILLYILFIYYFLFWLVTKLNCSCAKHQRSSIFVGYSCQSSFILCMYVFSGKSSVKPGLSLNFQSVVTFACTPVTICK